MEAGTPPPAAPEPEVDPFAEDAAPAAPEPAALPEPPAADVPVEEPPPAAAPPVDELAQEGPGEPPVDPPAPPPPVEPEDAEHVEPLPGEGEDREADVPPADLEPPQATGPGEEADVPPPEDPAPQEAEPAPSEAGKNRERDYTLMERISLGDLVKSLYDGENARHNVEELLGAIGDVLVYHPIHEVKARNQETAITRTFGQDGPHGREYKGDVATLPTTSLATKRVEVGTRTSVSVQIH